LADARDGHQPSRFGLLDYVWHPALFVFVVYTIILSSSVLLRAR
jgi:hypothetical protein